MTPILAMILADPHVSPAFQSAMAEQLPVRRAQYVSDLIRFDAQFEFSDDQRAWRKGRDELKRLRAERDLIDPDRALWNRNMHESYRHG